MKDNIPRRLLIPIVVGIVGFFANLLMTLFSQQIFWLVGLEVHYIFIGLPIFALYMAVFGVITIVTLIVNSREFLVKRRNKRLGITNFVSSERCEYLKKLIYLNDVTILISAILIVTLLIFWDNMDFPVFIVGEWLWAVVLLMCRQKIIDYKEEIDNA